MAPTAAGIVRTWARGSIARRRSSERLFCCPQPFRLVVGGGIGSLGETAARVLGRGRGGCGGGGSSSGGSGGGVEGGRLPEVDLQTGRLERLNLIEHGGQIAGLGRV